MRPPRAISAASSVSGRSSIQFTGSGGTHRSRLDSVVLVLTRSSTRSRIATGSSNELKYVVLDWRQPARSATCCSEPLVGRHRHEQGAAGRDGAAQLAQRGEIVLEVLDHIEAHRKVEAPVREWHLQHRAGDHVAESTLPGQSDAGVGQLHAGHHAEL
jgi:hypothetical protein